MTIYLASIDHDGFTNCVSRPRRLVQLSLMAEWPSDDTGTLIFPSDVR